MKNTNNTLFKMVVNKTVLLCLMIFLGVFANAQKKSKEERQAELDAKKASKTEKIKGNELAKEVDIYYLTLNLIDNPLSFSNKKIASIDVGDKKNKALKGKSGILYFNSEVHGINYISSYGWELINVRTERVGSVVTLKCLFRKLEEGVVPPYKD